MVRPKVAVCEDTKDSLPKTVISAIKQSLKYQDKLDVAELVMRVLAGKVSDVVSVAKSFKESNKYSAVSVDKSKKQIKQA